MSPKVKLSAYAVLLILAAWFAWGFYTNYSAVTTAAAAAAAGTNAAPASESNAPAAPQTAGTNNADATNALTNAPPPETNIVAAPETNPPPARTNAPPPAAAPAQGLAPVPQAGAMHAAMIRYLAAFVGAAIGLGLLIASDITRYFSFQSADYLFGDIGDAPHDPEYERAEAEWTNGKYLDAIQMMRDYLQKNPRQLHAALRIAEIYEKDLRNYVAAALEYEEALKHKLPAERWGWAAIHLCNLYSRLNQPDKALSLLRRIADEYPRTGAARKARRRLGIAEPEEEVTGSETEAGAGSEPAEESPVISIEAPPPPLPPPPPPPEPPKSKLPPGFRPK